MILCSAYFDVSTTIEISGQKKLATRLTCEELGQEFKSFGIDPAAYLLAVPLHQNQPRPVQLLQMMRHGRRRYPHALAQLSHILEVSIT